MIRTALVALAVAFCLAGSQAQAKELFSSRLKGNVANQTIAGFPSSVVTWELKRGEVSIFPFGEGHVAIAVRTRGLIIPALGFNPSPDLLARIVCHDAAGNASEAARTRAVEFPTSGDARLFDVVPLAGPCFAPIVLLTGSRDPQGESPGKFFAVSAF